MLVVFFGAASYSILRLSGIGKKSPEPTPTSLVIPTETENPLADTSKISVTCKEFSEGEFAGEFQANTTGTLAKNFPVAPQRSQLCGLVPSRNSVYYTSDLEDKVLMDYYKQKLEQARCSTTGAQPAPPGRYYAYSLPFTCTDGNGVVATLATASAYVVTFFPR